MPPLAVSPHQPGRRMPGIVAPLAAAAAAVAVYHRALAGYFSQDDWMGLARAAGLAPRLTGAWRYLSHQAFFDVMRRVAGSNAAGYHAVSLAAHAACAALLAVFLARVVARPAAMLGAAFFATHPALFDGVYWISAIGDSLALLGALGALLLASRGDRLRWAALPLFGLSLLAKESTLLLPLVALAVPADRPKARAHRGVVMGLGVVALVHLVALVIGDAFGVRGGLPGEAAYAIGLGPHIGSNALTYLGWSVNAWLPTMLGFTDAVDPPVFPWGVALVAVWLVGLPSRALRERGWVAAGVAFVAFLLPVLPLRNHAYHYYLYAPLAGVAWCVATIADSLLSSGRGLAVWLIAGAGAALLTLNGALAVRKIETMPFVLPGLRAEPVVDRARIARKVRDDIAGAPPPAGDTLLFWSPNAASLGPHGEPLAAPAPRETYWERNVRDALAEGLAVRVMFPQIAAVGFVREYRPKDSATRFAIYRPDGRLHIATSAQVDSALGSASGPH